MAHLISFNIFFTSNHLTLLFPLSYSVSLNSRTPKTQIYANLNMMAPSCLPTLTKLNPAVLQGTAPKKGEPAAE